MMKMDIPVYPCRAVDETAIRSKLVFGWYPDELSSFYRDIILTVSMKEDWGLFWNPKTGSWE